jgi:hypothetical protein
LEAAKGIGEDDAVALDLEGVAVVCLGDGSFWKPLQVEFVVKLIRH